MHQRQAEMTSISRNFQGKAYKRAIAHGYRSGLEVSISEALKEHGIPVEFEVDTIQYTVPERQARYTPDFRLPKKDGFWYLECKGIWSVADRAKHLLIHKQHDYDIRFLFSNAKAKLYKGSKTTYADYCDKHGFAWAHKTLPQEWIDECLCK